MSKQDVATVKDAQEQLPEVAGSAAIIQVIERAASDQSVDIEKMERLLEMHERVLNRNAEQAFNEAMKAAQEEMPKVVKNAHNEQTKSNYATLEAVGNAMNPTVTKHGFSMSFGTADSPLADHYRITCAVSHIGGHSRDYHADVPADTSGLKGTKNKTPTHGFGSTMSYGRRYLKVMIFDVSLTDDNDGNAQTAFVTNEQVEAIKSLAKQAQAEIAPLLNWQNVNNLSEIPAASFNSVIEALEKKKGQL